MPIKTKLEGIEEEYDIIIAGGINAENAFHFYFTTRLY